MAIETTAAYSGPLLTNGVTREFPFSFAAASAEEVELLLRRPGEADSVVSKALYTVALSQPGGTVTFATAPAAGFHLFIRSAPSFAQKATFEDGSRWLAGPVNEVHDRAAIRDIALKGQVDRAVSLPLGEAGYTLPPASTRAGKLLGFNAEGKPMVVPQLASGTSGAGGLGNGEVWLEQFGAVPDGDSATPTNNYPALKALVDHLREAAGTLIGRIGPGHFHVGTPESWSSAGENSPVNANCVLLDFDQCTIRGSGEQTVLSYARGTTNRAVFEVGNYRYSVDNGETDIPTGITISDLTIDLVNGGPFCAGIAIRRACRDVVIERVAFIQSGLRDGELSLGNDQWGVIVGPSAIAATPANQRDENARGRNITIRFCQARHQTQLTASAGWGVDGLYIYNNVIEDAVTNAIAITGISSTIRLENVQIHDNTIMRARGRGIYVNHDGIGSQSGYRINVIQGWWQYARNISITDNIIDNCQEDIRVGSYVQGMHGLLIDGNICRKSSPDGGPLVRFSASDVNTATHRISMKRHPWFSGDAVCCTAEAGGALPAGMHEDPRSGGTYFVKKIDRDTIELWRELRSDASGLPVLVGRMPFGSAGTGNFTMQTANRFARTTYALTPASIDVTANRIALVVTNTSPTRHRFADKDAVTFYTLGAGTLPVPLNDHQVYFVKNVGDAAIELYTSVSGSIFTGQIDFADAGQGSFYVVRQDSQVGTTSNIRLQSNSYSWANDYHMLTRFSKAVSLVNTATNRVTVPGHGLIDGAPVIFHLADPSSGSLPTRVTGEGTVSFGTTVFYADVIDADTIALFEGYDVTSGTLLGPVDLVGAGSGVIRIGRFFWNFRASDVEVATGRITLPAHGLADGTPVSASPFDQSKDMLATGWSASLNYYVKVVDANTVELYPGKELSEPVKPSAAGIGWQRLTLVYPTIPASAVVGDTIVFPYPHKLPSQGGIKLLPLTASDKMPDGVAADVPYFFRSDGSSTITLWRSLNSETGKLSDQVALGEHAAGNFQVVYCGFASEVEIGNNLCDGSSLTTIYDIRNGDLNARWYSRTRFGSLANVTIGGSFRNAPITIRGTLGVVIKSDFLQRGGDTGLSATMVGWDGGDISNLDLHFSGVNVTVDYASGASRSTPTSFFGEAPNNPAKLLRGAGWKATGCSIVLRGQPATSFRAFAVSQALCTLYDGNSVPHEDKVALTFTPLVDVGTSGEAIQAFPGVLSSEDAKWQYRWVPVQNKIGFNDDMLPITGFVSTDGIINWTTPLNYSEGPVTLPSSSIGFMQKRRL